ncbi:hypothetical protein HKBW3S06_00898 [Candidatus Hakubella thermalkaliphila]|uniref:Ribbon-helix-helix protein CopG domain-containing protein n=1 Tax=Candidatus Hakubella thermalkaliphila TaxID=2754717 RepID=A0A6V8QF49_9ACTN|nr:hypothetical protein [Candidatus Hakubella thermalkaliphila]GFP21671.1 hypothetical protein HKBW3S06_00898 [Candidatus Hakubella thermalkaliphila]GFP36527.1 hypothetical protein HKBW3S44_00210 [Candidatus Hakubella thermalkaliphila]GFP38739.1 hypothetical protein HKBW3S47_00440 [Candidatus Hakubella thermalkaliphila]GFP41411.1 hypothetical protein HKBW3C_00536 [Candidatus Hakubella thermalkaliphila]
MRQKVGTVVDEELLIKAKIIAARERKKFSEVVEEALAEYIAKKEVTLRGTAAIVEETKGALKADSEVVLSVMQEEAFFEV